MSILQRIRKERNDSIQEITIKSLWIVGKKTISQLNRIGIHTAGDLAAIDLSSSAYKNVLSPDVYEHAKALQLIIRRQLGRKHL